MLSQVSFDPSFARSHRITGARAAIRSELGVDVGFDFSDDLSTVILGLSLLPPEEDVLAGSFARLIERGRAGHRVRLFAEEGAFPADTDCTAVAAQGLLEKDLLPDGELAAFAGELLRAAAPPEGELPEPAPVLPGVVTVYWDDGRLVRGRKHDPVVCANVLCVLKEADRQGLVRAGEVIEATQRYVVEHLSSGAYRDGSRYYPYPEAFLHSVSRLAGRFGDCRELVAAPLAEALRDLEAAGGADRDRSINVALRTITAVNIGVTGGQPARRRLLARQQGADGAWPASPYYRLGRFPVYFGSRVLSTLFAASALRLSQPGGRR
ncbi:hypothetical protein [Amycolatopsis sp. 195334CR]|uniref:hypothetical protein n=1 Tax=Amycolatopsis sp. 195334CR TaxID=2814588 RepID=UPI001A8CD18C|nr:hypothetical protein [Amycolatopsis sp. 195334CR]MBN6040609.1 hypothetical protein [Amycolatopsis sp. 195334CR]